MSSSFMESDWYKHLHGECSLSYFNKLGTYLIRRYSKKNVFPEKKNVFRCFYETKFEDVKVVIIGQDPYHGRGQANGLAFAVNDGVTYPPSLKNIFKEVRSDYGECPTNPSLEGWAKQGVLLLNRVLTVEEGKPNSHSNKGWEDFTKAVVQHLSDKKEHIVFILWGKNAKSLKPCIDTSKHLVLESVHPSPLSANKGFFGCKHFTKTNSFLKENGLEEIQWEK